MSIPLNRPVCLKAHTGNNLQNEFILRRGRCNNGNTQAWEQLIFLKTNDGKIIIQSRWNGRNLQVKENGECVFANHNQDLWEKFDVEMDEKGYVYFISCHNNNVMQCDERGSVQCANKNRLEWERWQIIYPEETSIMISADSRRISLVAGLGIAGAAVIPIVGCVAGALVPTAMSTLGTVVAGVGTMHAVGGVAATLQATSAAFITAKAATVGMMAGATLGAKI